MRVEYDAFPGCHRGVIPQRRPHSCTLDLHHIHVLPSLRPLVLFEGMFSHPLPSHLSPNLIEGCSLQALRAFTQFQGIFRRVLGHGGGWNEGTRYIALLLRYILRYLGTQYTDHHMAHVTDFPSPS